MAISAAGPTYRSGNESVPAAGTTASLKERGEALEFLRALAKEVSAGSIELPCFPNIVVRISKALSKPDASVDEVVTIVGAEPRLAARTLQTANSAAFNLAGKPVTELRAAVTRLGNQTVQGIALSYAVQQIQNEDSLATIVQPLAELWSRSLAVASISRVVAQRTKLNPDEAFLAGLLHGMGLLYIMVRSVGSANAVSNGPSWLDFVAGWQAPIGKAVLESWGFPEHLCEAVGGQGDYSRRWKHAPDLTDVIVASIVLGDALHAPPPLVIATEGISAFQSIGVPEADWHAILEVAELHLGQVREVLGVTARVASPHASN